MSESSDNEGSKKITIPRFEINTVDTYGLMCAELDRSHREDPPSFYSRRFEFPNRPRTRTQVPAIDPNHREDYMGEGLSLRILKPSENKFKRAQKNDVDNPNPEEAGCSSQTAQTLPTFLGTRVERTYVSDINALTYELEKFPENLMIVFNHENFSEDSRREGSALDVAALRNTFEKLRFNVTVHNDLDEAELFSTLKQFSKQDFKRCGCICVAILSHGSDHGFLEAFDGWYSERAVFACFNTLTNTTLTDKPIIFLMQACRGRNLARRVPIPAPDETTSIQLDSANEKNAGYSLPAESNMIIFHSTFFGRASARDRHTGSWFIQTLCSQIDLYAESEDLEQIFMRVRNIVAREKEAGGGKQMPITSTALTKKLFLR